MCGIAGIMMKNGTGEIGRLLTTMLTSLQHRGPDSSGVAVYQSPRPEMTVTVAIEREASVIRVETLLGKLRLDHQQDQVYPRYRLITLGIARRSDFDLLVQGLRDIPGTEVHSAGYSMTLVKDTVRPEELNRQFGVEGYRGTHGIGHVRLATESKVACGFSHPFQSLDIPDLSIVHNGQITNYYKTRRRLEKKGYRFQTDNDSELIAQALACYLREGMGFSDALHRLAEELDGTYSFIVATAEAWGIAKDSLAAKPMMLAENDWAVAIASEEIAIRNIFGDSIAVEELRPSEVHTWSVPG